MMLYREINLKNISRINLQVAITSTVLYGTPTSFFIVAIADYDQSG